MKKLVKVVKVFFKVVNAVYHAHGGEMGGKEAKANVCVGVCVGGGGELWGF